MKTKKLSIFSRNKGLILSLPICFLLLCGCGDINYKIKSNITADAIDGKKNFAYIEKISNLFLNYPGSIDKTKANIVDWIKNHVILNHVSDADLDNLIQNSIPSSDVPFRFIFDRYISIYFYVDGSGSFSQCDPQIDGITYCLAYGGQIEVKKSIDTYVFTFNDSLNKKKDQIDKIDRITRIDKNPQS